MTPQELDQAIDTAITECEDIQNELATIRLELTGEADTGI